MNNLQFQNVGKLCWMKDLSFCACVDVDHNVKILLENVGVDLTRFWL